jgi:hypothetical protein
MQIILPVHFIAKEGTLPCSGCASMATPISCPSRQESPNCKSLRNSYAPSPAIRRHGGSYGKKIEVAPPLKRKNPGQQTGAVRLYMFCIDGYAAVFLRSTRA